MCFLKGDLVAHSQDLTQALDALEASLQVSIKQLSSFDKYKQEVLSGNLDWTPMHKDVLFWKENISKFEDNDFQVCCSTHPHVVIESRRWMVHDV